MPNQALDSSVDARRIKKRELDRRAQRLARERNKTRIAQLEAMVHTLQQTDSNTQTTELMDKLNKVAEERDSLVQILKSLNTQIGRHVKKFATSEGQSSTFSDSSGDTLCSASDAIGSQATLPTYVPFLHTNENPKHPSASIMEDVWSNELSLLGESIFSDNLEITGNPLSTPKGLEASASTLSTLPFDIVLDNEEEIIKPQPATVCDCSNSVVLGSNPRGVLNKWRAANRALSRPTKLSENDLVREDLTSEDTPVRVMLEGWDSVEREGKMTASWRKLRQVDEACFRNCDRTERLACLRIMHQLLTFHGDPSSERHVSLPPWLWMRPSQAIAHSYAIDFFVWPAIRERFIFSQHRYCTNLFWDLFQNNFKILWPYDFRDTYLRNSETGKYQLSPMFETRIRDINAWTMTSDFFAQFPELYEDIPAYLGLNPIIPTGEQEREESALRNQDDGATV